MAEGAMPGAPNISGTNEGSFSHHQPPPIVEGLDIQGQASLERAKEEKEKEDERQNSKLDGPVGVPEFSQATPIGIQADLGEPPLPPLYLDAPPASPALSAVPATPSPPHARAHFPEDPHELAHTMSARPGRMSSRREASSNNSGSGRYDGEKDREPASHRSSVWQSFRDWCDDWKRDFGPPSKRQDIQNLIGDMGIDVRTIRKQRPHSIMTGLMGSSTMLARPGLGPRTHSGQSVASTALGTPSGQSSGTSTPDTPGSRFSAGVDPREVARALRKLKEKMVRSGGSRQGSYVQAKAELAHRRNLVLLMVYAFMAYGAPTHRIEEYTLTLFKALSMEGRVNYTVGCTDISFINPVDPEDPMTRSAYSTIVKAQGLDIGSCEAAFRIYKDVVHGAVTIEEATQRLINLIETPPFYKPWFIVPFYGLASALAALWAYEGWWSDMPIAFCLGCCIGMLQIIVATRNPLYSNVLEVTGAFVTSFAARAFASIGGTGQKYFCFGAIAESSITTILPGYIVLCGALELQSKALTAGSTRLFYAVMYSLLLGYGIDVGAQLWAVIYPNAPTSASCPRSIDPRWKILLLPTYLVIQGILIRSRPRQIPIQVAIGSAAYTVNYFVSQYATAQVADTAAAFTLGILGHLWARSQRAFAFAAVVAGIMVLVPSGLAAQGGLLTAIETPLFSTDNVDAQTVYEQNIYQSFSVGAQMIQVGIGLSVGLFLSSLFAYPFGRKNNALFSF